MAFEKRFEWIIDNFCEGNRSAFSRNTGKTPAQITDICKGRGKPTFDYLLTLNEKFNINLHWLLTGKGNPMYDAQAAAMASKEDEFVYVPKYDIQASAGHGSFVDQENIVDYLAFRQDWIHSTLHLNDQNLVVITARGDSMEPTIKDGDILLVDLSQDQVTRDGLYVIRVNDTIMAKRVQHGHDGTLHIISDNPMYKAMMISREQQESVQAIGRLVWSGSRL